MQAVPYNYDKQHAKRYVFVSKGKKGAITKVVEFTVTANTKIFNLAFGDLLANGKMDDTANSNNGDIIKVLATIIQIIRDFTTDYPQTKIIFFGSTVLRTKVYHRILKSYYKDFSVEFSITGLIQSPQGQLYEILFEPSANLPYEAFLVKRKM